jgi:hypothetical protein
MLAHDYESDMRQITTLSALLAVAMLASGCQTFRPLSYEPSEAERARDARAGAAVEAVGNTVSMLSQLLP